MKIVDLLVMRGPNYWSVTRHNIIVLKLDLEDLEREPTHQIETFAERLVALLPGLAQHDCEHGEGSFMDTVRRGTWLGHVVEHVSLELQRMAGMKAEYGKTRSGQKQGIYHVLIAYELENAGRLAARAAVDLVRSLAEMKDFDLQHILGQLRDIARQERLGPSTAAIVAEAARRGIPCKRLDGNSLIALGQGHLRKKVRATVAGTTSTLGVEIARNKFETKELLCAGRIPVPEGCLVHDEFGLKEALKDLTFPLVIKPMDGNHGRGITTNIRTMEEAIAAFRIARAVSVPVIAEEFIGGNDYRLMVVNYRFAAAAERKPPSVTGNGISTVAQLTDQLNKQPERGPGHDNILTKITIDDATEILLARQGLTRDSVIEKGVTVVLKDTANLSTGGTAEDVTDLVHPYNIFLAERIARICSLDICGIDMVARDISQPLDRGNGAVVEVNAGPGLRMHLQPSKGTPRNIARPIVEMLFPSGNGCIPVVAITGTNGKTTTTRLSAHLAAVAGGHCVGYTTTDGIYVCGQKIFSGDCTGPQSTETILSDPSVDFAVLECARGGVLRSGLAFAHCDISVVTNVSADHLGLRDINTVEEMARVKSVIPRTTRHEGYAILNADDDLVFAMEKNLRCNIALFSTDPENERVRAHCENGGLAAVTEDGCFTICDGKWKTRIARIAEVPLTLGGRATCMIRNVLPAILIAHIRNWDREKTAAALLSFVPSPETTPGRMNIFNFASFSVMVDYAHNIDGMRQMKSFMENTPAKRKIGIIGIAGDRRNDDIVSFAALSAEVFDEIIIRHDSDMRGRDRSEMTELLTAGIGTAGRNIPVRVISSETEAVGNAIDNARAGDFITVCSEKVNETLAYVVNRLKVSQNGHAGQNAVTAAASLSDGVS